MTPDWRRHAACRTAPTEVFFSVAPEAIATAKAVCAGCDVRALCVAAAGEDDYGVWGGLTDQERRTGRPHRHGGRNGGRRRKSVARTRNHNDVSSRIGGRSEPRAASTAGALARTPRRFGRER